MGNLEENEIYEKDDLQLMKECLCKIENKNGKGTGFFCNFSYNNKIILVMIATNHLINDDIIKNDKLIEIKLNNDNEKNRKIIINEERKIYTSIKYDTTIIEINPEIDDIHHFLNLDEDIFKDNIKYENIYLLQYIENQNKQKRTKSKCIIDQINDYNIKYQCNSELDSSGCPLMNSFNNKVIGMHKETLLNFNNRGILLKEPLKVYINNALNSNNKNEINIKVKVESKDINKKIFFLYNSTLIKEAYKNSNSLSPYNSKNIELNQSNVELFINNKKHEYNNYFYTNKEGIYDIKLKLLIKMKDCSEMFYQCQNIIYIDLSFFNSENIEDTSYMFFGCINLEKINFSSFDTKNVTNMSNMFNSCKKLSTVNLSFFNTSKVRDMSNMFSKCTNLNDLYLSNFDTQNVTNMSFMFMNCERLVNLDLTSFDVEKVTNISFMFYKCYSLINVNLFSLDIKKGIKMDFIFDKCYNLSYIDLTDIKYNDDIKELFQFQNCINLSEIKL